MSGADRGPEPPPPPDGSAPVGPLPEDGGDPRPARFLVAIGGGRESRETLELAERVVKGLRGDVSILYVGKPIPHSVADEVVLSHRKLEEWEMDRPGIAFLRFAARRFGQAGLLEVDGRAEEILRRPFQPEVGGAFELRFPGAYGRSVRLRLREGQIAEEIRRETRVYPYDLLIIGAGTNRRLQHHLAQFVEISTLFVKNVRPGPYRLLLCTGGAPAGAAVAEFTARAARALALAVTVLSVDDLRQTREGAERWVAELAAIIQRHGVEVQTVVRRGKLVRTIIETAGDDHVIVIGRSHESELKKLFFGSRPIRVIQQARCPVIQVA